MYNPQPSTSNSGKDVRNGTAMEKIRENQKVLRSTIREAIMATITRGSAKPAMKAEKSRSQQTPEAGLDQ
jgi:hypothetical protein